MATLFTFVVGLLMRLNKWLRNLALVLLLLIIWPLLHWSNLESIYALGQPIVIADMHYAANPDFLKSTLESVAFPGFYIVTWVFLALLTLYLMKSGAGQPLKTITLQNLMGGALLLIALITSVWIASQSNDWKKTHPFFWTLATAQQSNQMAQTPIDNSITSGISQEITKINQAGQAKNVLLIVLEGIPGAYIKGIRDYFDLPEGDQQSVENFYMPHLSQIAESAKVTPNFVTHSRQTIRGLYSMLCADYSKLSSITLKSLEYISIPAKQRPQCLPELLAQNGYDNVYLQAAPLSFMGKDKFMQATGFHQTLGKSSFPPERAPDNWGPNDQVFFDTSIDKIRELQKIGKPWFLTLLTVGTHQPYLVPDDYAENYPNKKLASVAFLDDALQQFFNQLKKLKVPDDTLIIITFDESHAVANQPYGGNWGLSLVMAPDISSEIQNGLFGTLDISLSILDYLGLSAQYPQIEGRSLFQHYSKPRSLMFFRDKLYITQQDGVVGCNSTTSCVQYKSQNSKLFSQSYQLMDLTQTQFDGAQLYAKAYAADTNLKTLQQKTTNKNSLVFIDTQITHKKEPSNKILTEGQYFNIEKGHVAQLYLEAVNLSDQSTTQLFLQINHHLNQDGIGVDQELKLPVTIPSLKAGETLKIQLNINAKQAFNQVKPILKAMTVNQGVLNLKVNFKAVFEPSTTDKPLVELVTFEKKNADGKPYPIQQFDGLTLVAASYSPNKPVKTQQNQPGAEYLISGWSAPEDWGTWSIRKTSKVAFDLKDQNLKNCDLALEWISFHDPERQVTLKLNDGLPMPYQFTKAYKGETAIFQKIDNQLRDGINQIKFIIDNPESPHDLGLSDDLRPLGIGLKSFEVRCENAPSISLKQRFQNWWND